MSETKGGTSGDITVTKESTRTGLKVTAIVTVIALALGLFGGWAIAAASNDSAEGDLWVIPANGATVTSDTITLLDPASVVVGVTLEGDRGATEAPISKVVQQWDDVFGDTTPRAIVVGTDAGGSHSFIVELSKPSASADELTFPAVGVGGEAIPGFEASRATLVIDGSGELEAADVEALIAAG
ncbi:hypothetical protein [Demequina sp. NBRC 110053]|uniref:hypothetical protein n=1 Tax=Demequina sp. NBRC 110053 TaxID=1570342 RepID=UPI0009FEE942|nr:hypothetical protein [Demequina sp. NBRC 110053]